MRRLRLRRPSAAMIVALIALFFAFSGGAFAVVAKNQVTSLSIKNGAIHSADLGAGSVTSSKIRNGAVTPKKLSSATRADLKVLSALRNQTVTLSGYALVPFGLNPVQSTQNGCVSSYNGSLGTVPLAIPVGARITSVTAHTFASGGTYTMTLFRVLAGSNGLAMFTIRQASVSGVSGDQTTDVTPTTPETVDANESFLLRFDDGIATAAGFGNGALCDLVVAYRLAG
jgi:hypothetical protein